MFNGMPGANLRPVIAFPVIDRLLGLSNTPWSERYKKEDLEFTVRQKNFSDSIKATWIKNTKPSHTLNAYTGTYTNPIYGDMIIELQNDRLVFIFRKQKRILDHIHFDQFLTKDEYNDQPNYRLHFLINNNGKIGSINMPFGGGRVAEFVKMASPSAPLQ
ncbi:MAG: DUF3471 domain-containing protein [Chitinophagaceae bacterium]